MAHFFATPAVAGSGNTICFGSLESPVPSPTGMRVPPIFVPSQAFLFGSLDFVLSFAKYPKGCRCPRRCHRMTGSPTASCLPWTRMPGGSKRLWRCSLSCLSSWGRRATLPPVSLTSWMTTSGVMALASTTWHLATVRPTSELWWTLRSSRQG